MPPSATDRCTFTATASICTPGELWARRPAAKSSSAPTCRNSHPLDLVLILPRASNDLRLGGDCSKLLPQFQTCPGKVIVGRRLPVVTACLVALPAAGRSDYWQCLQLHPWPSRLLGGSQSLLLIIVKTRTALRPRQPGNLPHFSRIIFGGRGHTPSLAGGVVSLPSHVRPPLPYFVSAGVLRRDVSQFAAYACQNPTIPRKRK